MRKLLELIVLVVIMIGFYIVKFFLVLSSLIFFFSLVNVIYKDSNIKIKYFVNN